MKASRSGEDPRRFCSIV